MCRCGGDFQVHTTLQSYPLSSLGHRTEYVQVWERVSVTHNSTELPVVKPRSQERICAGVGEISKYTQLYRVTRCQA